jgi:OmpA-OmpF porin, OOP family
MYMRTAHSRASILSVYSVSVLVAVGVVGVSACQQRSGRGAPHDAGASLRQSLEEIRADVEKMQKTAGELRRRFGALPEDLPGLETFRSKLHAVEEVLGTESARVNWLGGELDAALASGKEDQVQTIAGTIGSSVEGIKRLTATLITLTHELLPFERMMAQFRALADAGLVFARTLPSGYEIKAASGGLEQRLLDRLADPSVKVDNKTWLTFDRLWFVTDTAQVNSDDSSGQLANLVEILKAYPRVELEIGGFSDNKGSAAANKTLSAARAQAVKDLLAALGVPPGRLSAAGFGAAKPLCPANDTDACRSMNWRVAARVSAK